MNKEQAVIDKAAYRRAFTEKPVFTRDQATAALVRHGLGPVLEWVETHANIVNAVYKATCTDGCYFVKIQFRPGFSLKTQEEATRLIREATRLPVSEVCILDEDTVPFGYPFLLSSQLPGEDGRRLFESSDETLRLQILEEYGKTIAHLHLLSPEIHALPDRDYLDWKSIIRTELIENFDLMAALPPSCRERLSIISELLADIEVSLEPVPQGFLWGDAVLHNCLFDTTGNLSGIVDFENAAWGDLSIEQMHVDAEFLVRRPREIYGREEYRSKFWRSYEGAGGVRITPAKPYMAVRKAVHASGFWWFWRAAHVLPPNVLTCLEELEGVLHELQKDNTP